MSLGLKDHSLVRLCTAIVVADWDEVRALRAAAPEGEPDREWREAVLQVHLFVGYPRLIQAFGVLAEGGGLGQPKEDEIESREFEPTRGAELFERIYGDGAPRVRGLLADYHADFAAWISEHAYARVLARPGLSAARRELLAACALAALGQDRQLASHARGALRCGATFEELSAAFDAVSDLIEQDHLERARRIAERFRS